MRNIHDLSGTIENGMWSYNILPGLGATVPEIKISPISSIKEDGFLSSAISINSISGTYLEAGAHMIDNAKYLCEYAATDFIKKAWIIRVGNLGKKDLVTGKLLRQNSPDIPEGDAIIISTGWFRFWNKPGYVLDCPNYTPDALEWVMEKKPSIFGVDVPCIEAAWSGESDETKGSILKRIFEQETLLAAPLVNLDAVHGNTGTLFCLPLKVKNTSGAPARIIIIEDI